MLLPTYLMTELRAFVCQITGWGKRSKDQVQCKCECKIFYKHIFATTSSKVWEDSGLSDLPLGPTLKETHHDKK